MPCAAGVALRKESVDRNVRHCHSVKGNVASLSARRAWIEMLMWYQCNTVVKENVALRKESVDRNVSFDVAMVPVKRRSPQGERG